MKKLEETSIGVHVKEGNDRSWIDREKRIKNILEGTIKLSNDENQIKIK